MARVLYFGIAREIAGTDAEYIQIDNELSVAELWDRLLQLRPGLASIRSATRVAVDMAYAHESDRVASGAEIALIPPVAGG